MFKNIVIGLLCMLILCSCVLSANVLDNTNSFTEPLTEVLLEISTGTTTRTETLLEASPDTLAEPTAEESLSNKKKIAIDAGHQEKGNSELEPIGPNASENKAKVASGTVGVSSKVPEYRLTLDVALKLKDELVLRDYDVYMIRETNDVNISNRERADMAADAGADILVRIHANGSSNSNDNGILMVSPTSKNPYISDLYPDCIRLSNHILEEMLETTKANKRGVWETDTMSGINWSSIPVTIVEMGYMSNYEEDNLMQTEEYQNKLVIGMANGIDRYFE